METIISSSLVLAFQIVISMFVLVIVGFFYVKSKKSKQADLTSKEDDSPPSESVPSVTLTDDSPPLPTVVPITNPLEKNPLFIYQCPSCGAEMEPGSEFCEACDYGMK